MEANVQEGALRRDRPPLPTPEKLSPDFPLNASIKRTVIALLWYEGRKVADTENMEGLDKASSQVCSGGRVMNYAWRKGGSGI